MNEIVAGARVSGGLLTLAAYQKDPASCRLLKEDRFVVRDLPDAAAPILGFLKLWRRKPVRFLFNIPRSMIIPRFLELPSLKMDELRGMSRYQALEGIPFPEEDLVWDMIALDKDRARGASKVFVAIARKIQLSSYFGLFEKMGRFPDAFALNCLAFPAYLKEEKNFNLENDLHIRLEDGWIELDSFLAGKLISTRAAPFSESGHKEERLAAECVRSISAIDSSRGRISRLIVSGDLEASPSNFLARFESLMQLPIEVIDSPNGKDWVLSGCCRTQSQWLLDLTPSDQKELRNKKIRRVEIHRFAFWGSLWVFSLCGILAWSLVRKKIEIFRLDSEIQKLEPEARKVSDMLDRMAFFSEQMRGAGSPAEVLLEVQAIAPADVALSALTFDEEGRLLLQGTADSYTVVVDFIRKLEASALFAKAELKTSSSRKIRDKEKVDFQIQCAVERIG